MTHIRTLKILMAIVIVSLITGCKIAVMVVEGGTVEVGFWGQGLSTCTEGTICIYEENYTVYGETFSAIPKPGWRFVKWSAGDDFLCSNSTSPHCAVPRINQNEIIENIAASSKTYYLMPLFAPLTEIGTPVTMYGKAWAPMNSFGDLSWDEINAVCPGTNGGRCLTGGQLMSYDMTGWTWASLNDVETLINSPVSGPINEQPMYYFYSEKFPPTASLPGCSGCRHLTWSGWTSTVSDVAGQPHLAEVVVAGHVAYGMDIETNTLLTDDSSAGYSAWFYRTP